MILNNLNLISHKNSDLLNRLFLCLLLSFLGINPFFAQTHHCHADEMLHHHLIDQGAEQELKEFKQNLKNLAPTRDEGQILTIPVVVHVIHGGESIGTGSNLSNDLILQQIEILNDDFNQLNSDQGQIPSEFAGRATNVELEFCLAQIDPVGNSTDGIIRTQFNNINSINFIESNIKPQTQWDPSRYMNVWVARMPNPAILGYAYFPIPSILGTPLDGIVISHLKIGNQSSITKGRTLVHEVGHYFGVPHLWGSSENDCNEDDGISDTPAVSTPYYDHPAYPQFSCGTSDMFMNYMDYVNDNCMFMFTDGQRTVMRSIINNQRQSLLSSNVTSCNAVVSADNSLNVNEELKMYPNPCQGELTITVPQDQSIKQLSVFDSSGKMIELQSITDKNSPKTQYINTDTFQNGMFLISVETYGGTRYSRRFVKLAN